MKIICGMGSQNAEILQIEKTLKAMGHQVVMVSTDDYRQVCTYWQKKLDKFGFHKGKENYQKEWNLHFIGIIKDFEPDIVLFINSPKNVLTVRGFQYVCNMCHTVLWFVDGVASHDEVIPYCQVCGDVFVFEKTDVVYLKDLYKIEAVFCPVGYNAAYSMIDQNKKIYDVAFVGSPLKRRLDILEHVAQSAMENGWSVKFVGPFYSRKYFWKKLQFKKNYPSLFKVIDNRRVSSEQTAEIYARSKICLNIHNKNHRGLNPRTFEIMATGSFELIDERDDYDEMIPNVDFVVYTDLIDLKKKIKYYLIDDNRICIAEKGYHKMRKYCLENVLRKVLLG